jgi:alpha-L-fucosidase
MREAAGGFTRREFMTKGAAAASAAMMIANNAVFAQRGAPVGAPDAYATPKPTLEGLFQPSWDSLRDHYVTPSWLNEAKFGIFIHWGLYAIPAHINEWYIRHMYTTEVEWHTKHYGPPDKFGYKDFIPLFTTTKYQPSDWAALFHQAGARYVVPVAEHHDGFAMWDSAITPWCAGKMGPKRDLIGELATAVKRQGMIFGLSSHRMEHHDFAYPAEGVPNDQFDPRYAGFYGPPVRGDMNAPNASKEFQEDWLARVQELIDKYEPQMIYFDNGVNPREYDGVKLRAAAYYYNRAVQWNKQATLASKDIAYLFGSVQDFEQAEHAPKWIYPAAGWQCDDTIGSTWGYTEGMTVRTADSVIRELIELSSMGGNLLLNVSPQADGSIPERQQQTLRSVGEWLRANGEGIYGSRPWQVMGEGPSMPGEAPGNWKGASSAQPGPEIPARRSAPLTDQDFRFTTNAGRLYVFGFVQPASSAKIKSLKLGKAKVERVHLLGHSTPLPFKQSDAFLEVNVPALTLSELPYALEIEGNMPL